jgi:hypothetical protein
LGIAAQEVTFARRGFRGGDENTRTRIEWIGRVFRQGYHAALQDTNPVKLGRRLAAIEAEVRGFAFEGAAMGLALLDLLTPRFGNRWRAFVRGPAAAHLYIAHVGVGWALARVPRRIDAVLAQFDPLLAWLIVDGYGFHEGFFHWPRSVERGQVPTRLRGYARRAFDQGLGRSLWFVDGADVARIAATVRTFAPSRRGDLWSGVGLACAYAGGVEDSMVDSLRVAAATDRPHLALGAAFAAKARELAGNTTGHTDRACRILCGVPAPVAAQLTDAALEGLAPYGDDPAYEIWRQRIRALFTPRVLSE